MNKQRFITLVLLISLAIASGPSVTHTSAAAPVPSQVEGPVLSQVEGPALSSVPSDVLSLPKGLSRGQVEGPGAPIEHSTDTVTLPEEDIRQSEYHVTWQDHTYLPGLEAAYQAPNRAQDLRTYFAPTGIRVVPRTLPLSPPRERGGSPAGAGGGWEWGLSLTGYGYAGDIQSVDAAELSASANRIEYRRGDIVEWYLNDEQGLEQGFTIQSPPTPSHSHTPLLLQLALTGDLIPALVDEGQAIEFTTSSGEAVLRYANLHVTDATGRQLPAHFSILHSQISILVDTTSALYPITIDPTITGLSPAAPTGLSTSADWMAESDQDSAYFGYSVSTAGDVNGDGYSDVIVGALGYDNGEDGEGRAYVYHGSASGLITTTAWFTESNQIDAYFGASVGMAGDVNGDGYSDVIIGAYLYDGGQTDEGRAYVYHGSATGLITTTAWFTEGDQIGAWFGTSVGTAGDVNGDGYSDVVVGAHGYDNGEDDEGRAYVYHGSATGLSATAAWTAKSDQAYANFGVSVGTAGDVNGDGYADVIVGAWKYNGDQTDEGRAYVYHGSATGLSATAAWTADESNQGNSRFGYSVGTAGDVNGDGYADVIVGAYFYDHGQDNEGRAYVYHGSATGLSASADWTAESDQLNGFLGGSVGMAGDVNGDGYSDVIVGAHGYDHRGVAFVWHGSATGLGVNGAPTNADWMAESNQDGAYFGISVSTAGDVNGDGYADVIVGAYIYDNGHTDEGAAFVYHGAVDGLSDTAAWTAESDQDDARFGVSVGTAGDVNGDGYADVIVGAHMYDNGEDGEGRAYVYHGSATGLITTTAWFTEGNQIGAYFGRSVSTAGDVDGDGYAGCQGQDSDDDQPVAHD
jgi:hypothetical protein